MSSHPSPLETLADMFSSTSLREVIARRLSNASRDRSSEGSGQSEQAPECPSRPATPNLSPKPSPRLSRSIRSPELRSSLIKTYKDSNNILMDFYAGGPPPPIRYATSGTIAPRAWREAKRLQEQMDAADSSRRYNSLDPESSERLDGRGVDSESDGLGEKRSDPLQIGHRPTRQRKAHPKLPMAYKRPTPRVFKPLLPADELDDERKSPLELVSSDSEDEGESSRVPSLLVGTRLREY